MGLGTGTRSKGLEELVVLFFTMPLLLANAMKRKLSFVVSTGPSHTLVSLCIERIRETAEGCNKATISLTKVCRKGLPLGYGYDRRKSRWTY